MNTPTTAPVVAHTSTPWATGSTMTRVEVWPRGWNTPMCVADCHAKNAPDTEIERVANAAFIVLAANNHAQLREACNNAAQLLLLLSAQTTGAHHELCRDALGPLRATLKESEA